MRSIKELLNVMLINPKYFKGGLCYWSANLHIYGLISVAEYDVLLKYIDENKPSPFSSWNAFIQPSASAFYWTEGKIEPRIKWIKKHIKRNSK